MDSTSVNQKITNAPENLGSISEFISYLSDLSEFISHVAWPITVLIIAFLFRNHLSSILQSVTRLKVPGVELEFDKDVKRITDSAKTLPDSEAETEPSQQPMSESDRIFSSFEEQAIDAATLAPSAAILLAWANVEAALRSAVRRMSLPSHRRPSSQSLTNIMNILREAPQIPKEVVLTIEEMRIVRNKVAHEEGYRYEISSKSAEMYVDTTIRITHFLNRLEHDRQ